MIVRSQSNHIMCKLWVVFLGFVGKLHQAKSREIKIDIKTNKNIVTHTLFLVETVEHVKHVIVLKIANQINIRFGIKIKIFTHLLV
jgi:hypothetical protein